MFNVNPDWGFFFSRFLLIMQSMVKSIGDVCMKAFYVLQSYTVREALAEITPSGIVGDVINAIAKLFISDWFLGLYLWEFLLFAGVAFSVILSIVKAIK